jgi:hypothetical protein
MMIKQRTKLLTLVLALTLLLTLTACGGGGGDEGGGGTTQQAQKVTATFALQGSAVTIVGAVDLDVLLPAGFVLETDTTTGQPIDTALTFLVPGATFVPNYLPETTAVNGEIKAGMIKSDGFAGNSSLVQVSRTYAAGTNRPSANDFMVTVIASDLNGATLAGISGKISISTQPAP